MLQKIIHPFVDFSTFSLMNRLLMVSVHPIQHQNLLVCKNEHEVRC